MDADDAIAFDVTYRLGEYLSLVRSHVLATGPHPNPSRLARLQVTLTLALVGTAMFLVKSRRIGSCAFLVDVRGITRTSNEGPVLVPWARVVALHAYETGYLVELREGAMPIPYRVLSSAEVERLPQMVSKFVEADAIPVLECANLEQRDA